VIEFILKFSDAVIGKSDEEANAVIRGFRIADFVGFHRREIVLICLLRRTGACKICVNKKWSKNEQKHFHKFHGCFSEGGCAAAGGLAGGGSGRRGKSIRSISSSKETRSRRTRRMGGLYCSGAR